MEPYQVIILIAGVSVLLIISLWILGRHSYNLRKEKIETAIRKLLPDCLLTWEHVSSPFQLRVETDGEVVLIKVIPFAINHELIITNPTFWCVNQSPQSWKRSSTPELVPGVEAFMKAKPETAKSVRKIALIYPGCHNITRYLNESDVEVVTCRKAVNSVYFVRFSELEDFFRV